MTAIQIAIFVCAFWLGAIVGACVSWRKCCAAHSWNLLP
jgi:hypothetical protein